MKTGNKVKFFGTKTEGIIIGLNWDNGKITYNVRVVKDERILKSVQKHEITKINNKE